MSSEPIPYRDPIAQKASKLRSFLALIARKLGMDARFPNDPDENKVTQPWIKWFRFVSQALVTDPYFNPTPGPGNDNDMWDIGFWANADDAGAPGATAGDGEVNHPGIITLTTGAVANNTAGTWSAGAGGYVPLSQITLGRYVFETPPDVTTCRFEVGMTSNPQSGWTPFVFETGNDMFYAFYDTNVDTALRVKVRAGGATTVSTTVINPCPVSTWIDLLIQTRLVGSATVVDLIVNGKTRVTVSGAQLPASTAKFGSTMKVSNRVAADRTMRCDFGRIKPASITQRWTNPL